MTQSLNVHIFTIPYFFPFPISTTENSFLTKAPQPDPLDTLLPQVQSTQQYSEELLFHFHLMVWQ